MTHHSGPPREYEFYISKAPTNELTVSAIIAETVNIAVPCRDV